MPEHMDNRAYYDAMSRTYERGRHDGYHAFLDDSEVACVADRIAGVEVLEVGCGTGLILQRMAPVARRVAGIDLSPGMLEMAASRGFDVQVASASALPFADGTFDGVVCFKVLPHIEAVGSAIAEMVRVVRPGGWLALEFYNPRSFRGLIKRLKRPTPIGGDVADTDVYTRLDTLSQAVSYLPAGVRVVRTHGIRIAIVSARWMRIPVVGRLLGRLDRALSHTWLKHLAGFIVIVAEKSQVLTPPAVSPPTR